MEKKIKRSGRPPVGRVKARREAARLVINPTIKSLISGGYPSHCVLMWLRLFSEFGIGQIIPSSTEAQNRMDLSRYKLSISMTNLKSQGLAEEIAEVKNQSWGGRPGKVYRLLIP